MSSHSIQCYFEKVQPVFSAIPDMAELRCAKGDAYAQLFCFLSMFLRTRSLLSRFSETLLLKKGLKGCMLTDFL